MKAVWQGQEIARSEEGVVVEGNYYFPERDVNFEFLKSATNTTMCPWKGTANYYDLKVSDAINKGAAWVYRTPSDAAAEIKDHIAFWKGVVVSA